MFTFSRASASAAALALTLTLSACGGGHHHGNPGPGPGPGDTGPTYDVIPIGLPGIAYGEVTRRGIAKHFRARRHDPPDPPAHHRHDDHSGADKNEQRIMRKHSLSPDIFVAWVKQRPKSA